MLEWKHIKGKIKLCREIILSRLNLQTDFAGYDILLQYIQRHCLYKLPGDIAEIGAFMGGGTRKLGEFFKGYGKKIIVVDLFDPSYDNTENERGEAMSSIYRLILGNRDLMGIFSKNIARLKNVVVYRTDSKKMIFNDDMRLCFSIIDGNHDPSYVKNDFKLLWEKTVNGGAVALHDYGGDLPQVTSAIDSLIRDYAAEISLVEKVPSRCFIFLRKRGKSGDGRTEDQDRA